MDFNDWKQVVTFRVMGAERCGVPEIGKSRHEMSAIELGILKVTQES